MMMKSNGHKKPARPIQRLADLRPQRKNINKGKPHGLAALDASIRRDGYSAPMVAAADGEVFAGSKRLERVADVMPGARPIIIHSDGNRPIVHIRDDIPNANDPRAKRLGFADNVIGVMDWNPDGEILAELAAEDDMIRDLARQESASLEAMVEALEISGVEALSEKEESIRSNKMFHVLISLPIDSAILAKEDIERIAGITGVQVLYGAN